MTDWLHKQLEEADPDLLREMVRSFAETLMGLTPKRRAAPRTGRFHQIG